jgi:hypothetical protein
MTNDDKETLESTVKHIGKSVGILVAEGVKLVANVVKNVKQHLNSKSNDNKQNKSKRRDNSEIIIDVTCEETETKD